MSNKNTQPVAQKTELPALTAIKDLFGKCRDCESTHDLASARKFERQVADLVAQIAVAAPNSADHADALAYHEYTLLSLSRTCKRPLVSKSLRDAAYAKGAASVQIQLDAEKPDLGTVFAAHNLAIDLICTEKRSLEGLQWMLKAGALLNKLAGKKKLPRNILDFKLYSVDFGIAKAYYDMKNPKTARTMLKRALRHAPALNTANWSELRGVAKCSELLAQIYLDEMDAARSAKQAA
jgi:tetratricopeptide (TPR) repeat protein